LNKGLGEATPRKSNELGRSMIRGSKEKHAAKVERSRTSWGRRQTRKFLWGAGKDAISGRKAHEGQCTNFLGGKGGSAK